MPIIQENGACRDSVQVKKRVLIRGRGGLGETKVDHRGNSPAFRLSSSSVLLNLDLDMTGYREALKFEGSDPSGALMHDCIVRCTIRHFKPKPIRDE